jgi:hypothetical protein
MLIAITLIYFWFIVWHDYGKFVEQWKIISIFWSYVLSTWIYLVVYDIQIKYNITYPPLTVSTTTQFFFYPKA